MAKKSNKRAVPNDLSVGAMAERAGVPVSTLHYYEAEGLIESWRTDANHRRYDRRELRRLSIIRVAQQVGIPLSEVKEVLDTLPRTRAVTARDWARVGALWQDRLRTRIALMEKLAGHMDHCIGCGCLSLESCPLYNKDDTLGSDGSGARRWT
ncbi:redox-sensitive transcriptional activator SoxR [Pseudaestuariivita sp.]|uniref:redox-sensitive transcriptional activator SoxR n=1 Tax=Pseudaestuariivita sp. TaxID=2211669 RepID=UPI004059CD9E